MDFVLDYSGYLEDRKSSTPQRETTAANSLFFDRPGWCPFCKAIAQMVADEKDEAHVSTIDEHGVFRSAWQCPCGWWQTYYYDWRHDSGSYWDYYGARNAILRQYDASDSDVPVTALRRALLARPNLIDMVSRKKTEELVGSVFADHFDCEVRMVGKSHDKGIDLVLVRSDKVTVLVQVKHRDKNSKNWRAEPVSTVREFLGAFMLAKRQHAILVTTARRFSREAKEAAAEALTLRSVHQYDLMDGAELLRTLRLTSDRVREQWRDNLVFTVK